MFAINAMFTVRNVNNGQNMRSKESQERKGEKIVTFRLLGGGRYFHEGSVYYLFK